MHFLYRLFFTLQNEKCETLQLTIHTYIHNFRIPTYKTVESKKFIARQKCTIHMNKKQIICKEIKTICQQKKLDSNNKYIIYTLSLKLRASDEFLRKIE